MNQKGLTTNTRAPLSNGISTPKRKTSATDPTTVRCSPYTPSSIKQLQSINKTPVCARPIKATPLKTNKLSSTAFASPRKNSAPSTLLSTAIGESLETLPNVSTVRRKISTPVRPNPSTVSQATSRVLKRKTPCVVAVHHKKTLVVTASSTGTSWMSKDHGGSSHNLGPQITSGAGSEGKSKKTSSENQSHPLPTLKEEKKTKLKSKKNSREGQKENSCDRLQETVRAASAVSSATTGFSLTMERARSEELLNAPLSVEGPLRGDMAPPNDLFPEKAKMEKTVSDLIKNNETKKQEIAALKMENNRLKEAAREKPSQSPPSEACSDRGPIPAPRSKGQPEKVADEASCRLQGQVDSLTSENRLLREHLKQLGISLDSSPLSDQQKELILNRVSALSQTIGSGDSIIGDREWDTKSCSSISEISVACLQGRIHQMEETHYSTNEELQATLQELDDLKEQLTESHAEVQQLQEEKQVILESLTQQTEKLNESRGYNDTLKSMLIQHSENSEDLSQCEKTQRLMELLKSVQEDREFLNLKQEELDQQFLVSKNTEEHYHREARLIRDRMKLLEAMVEDANHEKKNIESQILETKESLKASEKEVIRLKGSLAAAKEKINELEATVISGEKSELADVLERVCGEKEALERESSTLHKKANGLVCENEKLKEQMAALQDDLRVTRNNAKTNLDDIEYKRLQLDEKRRDLEQEVESLKSSISELQITCQHHLEDKRDLKANLSESQKKLSEMLDRNVDAERGFAEERTQFSKQVEEWEQFQDDLLTTVRVANDFKTEAQHDLEKLQHENQSLKERLKSLDHELDKARVPSKLPSPGNIINSTSLSNSSNVGFCTTASDRRLLRSVSQIPNGTSILTDRRSNPRPLERGDSRVKSLIESIECATKHARVGSRSSSTSSLASTSSETNNNHNAMKNASVMKRADTESLIRHLPSSLSSLPQIKDNLSSTTPLRTINCNTISDPLSQTFPPPKTLNSNLPDNVKINQLTNDKSNKLNGLFSPPTSADTATKPVVSILANKIEPIRRNSYGQLLSSTDKKDPLASLAQSGGSKRNALLKWCQMKTIGYNHVDITNFSSSWNDGLALCAILDTYLSDRINYDSLNPNETKKNFEVAIMAAESVGIPTTLDITSMLTIERPSWQMVFNYVTSIYCHFET